MKRILVCMLALLLGLVPALGCAEAERAPLDAALEAFDAAYGALDGSSVAIAHAYLIEVADRDALSEHGAALFERGDACVYIIAEQTVDGFAIPYIMEICYLVNAEGEVELISGGLGALNAYEWQTEYAGLAISDVTEGAQAS